MEFVLNPSLEHRALVKIVISLWNQDDVTALIANLSFSNPCSSIKWETIEETVMKKVSQLPLPHPLKEKVLYIIKPIGLEVSMWMEYNQKYLDVNLPADFYWTPQGTVDRKKTAEVLVRDKNLDMSIRYKLACMYCLENNIYGLWNSFTKGLKKSLLNTNLPFIYDWSHYMMRRELGSTRISYKDEFQRSAHFGNRIATEYFLQKLTPQEKEESLVKTAEYLKHVDVLFLLISEMNTEQQIELFKSNPYQVLQCFLQWPFQSFFIRVANCMWDFLSVNSFDTILRVIIMKVTDGFKDFNYQELFREFWKESPGALKSLITNEIESNCLLPLLFHIKDKESIQLILKDFLSLSDLPVKEKFFYSDTGNIVCQCSVRDNEWDFLEFCIRECLSTENAMLKFKEEFEKRMMHSSFKEHFAIKKHKWDQLFLLSDDSTFKYDKRSLEEGESSSSKRFLSLQ